VNIKKKDIFMKITKLKAIAKKIGIQHILNFIKKNNAQEKVAGHREITIMVDRIIRSNY